MHPLWRLYRFLPDPDGARGAAYPFALEYGPRDYSAAADAAE